VDGFTIADVDGNVWNTSTRVLVDQDVTGLWDGNLSS
jgi:hypothetical protein